MRRRLPHSVVNTRGIPRSRVCAGCSPVDEPGEPPGCGPATRAYRELVARTRDQDACPGALQVHHAADGVLARVRLPGGMITAQQLETLALAATQWASPAMEITSRGNLQIRAVTDTAAVADSLSAAGL